MKKSLILSILILFGVVLAIFTINVNIAKAESVNWYTSSETPNGSVWLIFNGSIHKTSFNPSETIVAFANADYLRRQNLVPVRVSIWATVNGQTRYFAIKTYPPYSENTGGLYFTAPSTPGNYLIQFNSCIYDGVSDCVRPSNASINFTVVGPPSPPPPPPPISEPILNFSASATMVTRGQFIVLNWTTSNATGCTASDGWSGTKPLNGSESVGPLTQTTYTLACVGAGGSVVKSQTITVNEPTPTVEFFANKDNVAPGDPVYLEWASKFAQKCVASSGWSGLKPVDGQDVVFPSDTTTYILTCTGPGGSVSKSVNVNVVTPAPIIKFMASDDRVDKGGSVILSWDAKFANSCFAAGNWSGDKPLRGSEKVTLLANSIYILVCSGPSGETVKSVAVKVDDKIDDDLRLKFSADPMVIKKGQSSVLSWEVEQAETCVASGGWSDAKPLKGSETVTPSNTATYILTCVKNGKSISRSVTVAVKQSAPIITFTATSFKANGQPVKLSWRATNAFSCKASGGWSGVKLLSGSVIVSPSVTTTYTLTCTGVGGTAKKSMILSAKQKSAPDLSFTAEVIRLDGKKTIELRWYGINSDSCTAFGGWSGEKMPNGFEIVSLSERTTYTLTCSGPGGEITKSVIVDSIEVVGGKEDKDASKLPILLLFASMFDVFKNFFAYLFSCEGIKWLFLVLFLITAYLGYALWKMHKKQKGI